MTMLRRAKRSLMAFCVAFAEAATLLMPLASCKDPASYARLGVDASLAGLDAQKRARVRQITIRSRPENATDSQSTYQVTVTPADLDQSFAYHLDYVPATQKGAFVVSVSLASETSEQLAIRSERVVLAPGKTVRAELDFVSEVTTAGSCIPEADAVDVSDTAGGSKSFTLLWDEDHYLYVYEDLTYGKGDLVSQKLDAWGRRLSAPMIINSSPRVSTLPSLAKIDGGFVVAWQEGDSLDIPVAVELRHLDHDGAPVGNIRTVATYANESRPQILPAFGKLAMTWIDHRMPNDDTEHLALVAFLDPSNLSFTSDKPIALTPPGATKSADAFPGLSLIDSTLVASWVSDGHTVYTTRLSDKLEMQTPEMVYSSEFTAQQLWVISAGDRFFTTWEDLSGDLEIGRERIRSAYTNVDGTLGAGDWVTEPVDGSANWPRAAYDGHGSVAVVFYQYRDFGSQIYLQRFTPDGQKLDEPEVQITDVLGQAKYPNIQLTGSDESGDHFAIGWVSDHTGLPRVYLQPFVCQ